MLQFTKACKKYVPSVVLTVVDIIGVEKIKLCQKIADGLGVELRVSAVWRIINWYQDYNYDRIYNSEVIIKWCN